MLEIILLFTLGKSIAGMAKSRGMSGWPFVILLILFWFGGEIGGAVLGVIVSVASNPETEPNMLLVYLGALLGAGTAFGIVALAGSPTPPPMLTDEERWKQ